MKTSSLSPEAAQASQTAAPAPKARGGASPYWNPYVVGAGLGVLSWIVFAVVNHPLGVSTALSTAAGEAAKPILGAQTVSHNAYWSKTPFAWDYGMLFLVGLMLGSAISVLLSRTFRVETVPSLWRERFGGSVWKRMAAAFLGGVLLMYGARMAGGCTSGHGISGALQLAVSSWVFLLVIFAAGMGTAWLLFHKRRERALETQPSLQPETPGVTARTAARKGAAL